MPTLLFISLLSRGIYFIYVLFANLFVSHQTGGINFVEHNVWLLVVGTLITLAIVVSISCFIFNYRRKLKQTTNNKRRPFNIDAEGSVASRDPLIPGQSLRDLIDTTSGSGMSFKFDQ